MMQWVDRVTLVAAAVSDTEGKLVPVIEDAWNESKARMVTIEQVDFYVSSILSPCPLASCLSWIWQLRDPQ